MYIFKAEYKIILYWNINNITNERAMKSIRNNRYKIIKNYFDELRTSPPSIGLSS